MIILASGSPRRKELLTEAGISFKVEASDFDESTVRDLDPGERAKKLAFGKAVSVYNRGHQDETILAADTLVHKDGEFFGKPKDEKDVHRIIGALSNGVHEVYTGVCIFHKRKMYIFYDVTKVYFRQILKKEIDEFIKTGEPFGKAGAYGIQGYAKKFVNFVDGDINTVIGLPVTRVLEEFKKIGVINEKAI